MQDSQYNRSRIALALFLKENGCDERYRKEKYGELWSLILKRNKLNETDFKNQTMVKNCKRIMMIFIDAHTKSFVLISNPEKKRRISQLEFADSDVCHNAYVDDESD